MSPPGLARSRVRRRWLQGSGTGPPSTACRLAALGAGCAFWLQLLLPRLPLVPWHPVVGPAIASPAVQAARQPTAGGAAATPRKKRRWSKRDRKTAAEKQRQPEQLSSADVADFARVVDSDEAFDSQLLHYAYEKLPHPGDEAWLAKREMLETVEKLAQRALCPSARCLPFGSSANACGAVSSDLDVVLYAHPDHEPDCEPPKKQGKKALTKQKHLVQRTLKRIYHSRTGCGLVQDTKLIHARVPLISFSNREGSCQCDVSYKNYLPLYNSRLIRAYSELEPRLPLLAIVIKRMAKELGISSAADGYISSYSWTLMTIYYLQVCHGLQSLHKASSSPQLTFATNFRVDVQGPLIAKELGPAALLRGFFSFYAKDFDWEEEVVSVRLGARTKLGSPQLHKTFKLNVGTLNIEDPIELPRNLNFALKPDRVERIRTAVQQADVALAGGAGLPDFMLEECTSSLPSDWLKDPQGMLRQSINCFLKVPVRQLFCDCEWCGEVMELGQLLEHQLSCRPPMAPTPMAPTKAKPFVCLECNRSYVKAGIIAHQAAKGHKGIARLRNGKVVELDIDELEQH